MMGAAAPSVDPGQAAAVLSDRHGEVPLGLIQTVAVATAMYLLVALASTLATHHSGGRNPHSSACSAARFGSCSRPARCPSRADRGSTLPDATRQAPGTCARQRPR